MCRGRYYKICSKSSYALEIRILLSKGADLLQCSSVDSFFKSCKYFSLVDWTDIDFICFKTTAYDIIQILERYYKCLHFPFLVILISWKLSVIFEWSFSVGISIIVWGQEAFPFGFCHFIVLFFLNFCFTASRSCKNKGNNSFLLWQQDKLLSV